MKKISILALSCALLHSCGQDKNTDDMETPSVPVFAKDTEAHDLKGNVRSVISVSWGSPSSADMNLSFDSLHAKASGHIAKYIVSGPSVSVSKTYENRPDRAQIRKEAFDSNGHFVIFAQYKKSWRPRHVIRTRDTVMFYDTAIDGSIIYHDTTILNPDRSVNRIIDEFTTITDSILMVKTSLVRKNILRNDTAIVWAQTTAISGHVPEPIPPSTDTVTYKVLGRDHHNNPLKVLVSHSDKLQPRELIMYKYTYYE